MDDWKTGAQKQFDAWSRSYDKSILQRVFFRPAHNAVIDKLSANPPKNLLDVGCGTGRLLFRLLDRFPEMKGTGIDISDQMLSHARDNGRLFNDRLTLKQGDSEALPFPDQSFDAVTCVHSFHHYPKQQEVMREMLRVLAPGGTLSLIDADRDRLWGWILFDGVVTAIERSVSHCSIRKFRDLVEAAGFHGLEIRRYGWLTPYLLVRAHTTSPSRVKVPSLKIHAA